MKRTLSTIAAGLVFAFAVPALATNIPVWKPIIPDGEVINGTEEAIYEIPPFSQLSPQATEGVMALELQFTSVAGAADVKVEVLVYSLLADRAAIDPPAVPFYQMSLDGVDATNRSLKIVSTGSSFGEDVIYIPIAIPSSQKLYLRITGNATNPGDTIPKGIAWIK